MIAANKTSDNEAIYIGENNAGNELLQQVKDTEYFVYNRKSYDGRWSGYQIAIKFGPYCIPHGLPYRKLQAALDIATDLNAARPF